MLNKGLLLALALSLLSACDSSREPTPASVGAPAPSTERTSAAPAPERAAAADRAALAARYAGRELKVVDVSEVQLDGASALSVTFSVPLDPEQPFAERLHLVDSRDGSVDGAWELSDNLSELRLRHLEPQRKLVLTVDAGLRALSGAALAEEHVVRLSTRDLQASVGFASRGSLLPTRLAEGLPVVALNVDKVNVEFFRIRNEALPAFLARWGRNSNLDSWEARELLPMADLVYGARFDLAPARNTRETLLLPIGGIAPLQQPGVYLAVMREAGRYSYSQPATLFSLSDIGLSAHRYRERLEVFAQALDGGKSLAGVDLELLDAAGSLLGTWRTDARGHASLPLSGKARLLLARSGGQTSLLRLDTPALDLAEFDIAGPQAQPLQLFVFGPRDLYRPGESVPLNALLRDADGRAVEARPLSVEVRRPDGQVGRKFVWHADAQGLYQYRLELAEQAPTGRWQLRIDLGNGRSQLHEFLVEDFLPERLALELEGRERPYAPQEDPEFRVAGRYLYGAPAAGNRLSGQLYVRPLREAVPALPGYQFGDITETDLEQEQELEERALDAEGRARVRVENRWSEVRSPLQLILQASLQESGGRPITRRLVQPVWPAERLPGLRGLFDGDSVDANGLAEFELLVADPAGNKLAADNLQVRLVRERRDYFWSFSERDGWSHNFTEKFLTLSEEPLRIAAGATAKVSFPVEWGPYRVELLDKASGLRSSLRFWAGYRWQDNAEGGAVRPDQVRLALDKPAYREGERARVTVTPPAAGKGYLLVESADGPLWWQEIEVPAEGRSFDVPIARDWQRHDLYLSALVVRPGEREAGITPKRAVGLLHLPLERAPQRLALSLQAPERMRPGQPLKVKVRARHADGGIPARARVLVAAVDVGILNITEFATPDPFAAFFGRKGYGVDQLDVYGQLIEAGQGRLASLAFGGDAGLAAGGKPPSSSVLIVAQQSEALSLDAQGEGEVSLDIPDFNGELRLMAQAWTDERYGMAEAKTLVAAPLIAELAMPRFLAGGDETRLALDLANRSGQAQQLAVTLHVDGQLQLLGEAQRRLQLADGQRTTVQIPVRAHGGLGEGRIRVEVAGVRLPDEEVPGFAREWRLGVRPAWPAQMQQFRAVLGAGESWSLPAGSLAPFETAGLQAGISLSSRPPLNLGEQIRQLKAYPYGCLEQTTSGLYPSLYADVETLQRLGLRGETDEQRRRAIELGIERLLAMQQHRGGFGLWSVDGEEEYWLSVYVTDFLLRARERGFGVPEEALNKASERLLRYLQQNSLIDTDYTEDPAHTRFAVQAYAGYVLARSRQAPLGALRSLFERRGEARSGLPLVQLAAALELMGDAPRAAQALAEGLERPRARHDWLADYGSPVRDQALILALLEEHDLAAGRREQRLFALAEELAVRNGLSTQERNALFLAGRHLLGKPEAPWAAQLSSGEQPSVLSGERPSLRLEAAALVEPLTLEATEGGPLYAQLSLSGYPAQAPSAGGENLSIQREYLGMDGQPLDLERLRSGQLVLVHLLVRARERVGDALVVDLLPAGLELENQNLLHASASLEDAGGSVRDWLREMRESTRLKHQEYRDDRYVAAVDVNGYAATHLLYLARAVTPGSYRVPPPLVESMYRPQWQARGAAAARLRVLEP